MLRHLLISSYNLSENDLPFLVISHLESTAGESEVAPLMPSRVESSDRKNGTCLASDACC